MDVAADPRIARTAKEAAISNYYLFSVCWFKDWVLNSIIDYKTLA